ncbi:type VII secretion target [Nocardia sp. NPDC048505]|uniref:type VII secretion target n=1 Tax=unclassified Nocardia TaxID=2637762 RepID=UPI0033D1C910
MAVPDSISVDPDEVKAHADAVTKLVASLDKCLAAASYLDNADDGFGLFPAPFIAWLYSDKTDQSVALIRALAESVATVPDKLKTVAATFEDKDGQFGAALTGLKETIGEGGGSRS